MKKVLVIVSVLALVAAGAFAADAKTADSGLDPLVGAGDLLVNVGIGWGGIAAGAEFDLATIKVGPLPLTFGVGARAAIDPLFSDYGMPWAVGAFGTAHLGFKGIDLPSGLEWISKTDTYIGLGLGVAGIIEGSEYDWYNWKPGVGISFIAGESYFLTDTIALYGEYGYMGKYSYEYDWGGFTYKYSFPWYYASFGVIVKLLGK